MSTNEKFYRDMKSRFQKNLIMEDSKKLNENTNPATVFNMVSQLDAHDTELFFVMLANYFQKSINTLDNMDAKGISEDLFNIVNKIKNRTGN